MKKESTLTFRNPKNRELSPFFAEQLLYDYSTKKVDPLREKAVADAISASPDLAKSLDDIIYGKTYCQHLRQTKMTTTAIAKLKTPLGFRLRMLRLISSRHWSKTTVWVVQGFVFGLLVILVTLSIPWSKIAVKFIESQHPQLLLSEISHDKAPKENPEPSPIVESLATIEYNAVAELSVVNPEFTSNKLSSLMPRLGASIEHSSLRKNAQGQIQPYLRISIPNNQTEALFSELNSQGQLTWVTPPSENDKKGAIFGMELWVAKTKSLKGRLPAKDKTEE